VPTRGEIGLGTTLAYATASTGPYTPVARLTEIGEFGFGEADIVDVTGYDSPQGLKEFISGLKDLGELSVKGIWTADTSQQALINMQGQKRFWRITLPQNLGTWTAEGFVRNLTINPQLDDRVEFSATLKITGVPTFAVP